MIKNLKANKIPILGSIWIASIKDNDSIPVFLVLVLTEIFARLFKMVRCVLGFCLLLDFRFTSKK